MKKINKKLNFKTKNIELIIRPSARIKSRQWWKKVINHLKDKIKVYSKKKKINLFENYCYTLLITNNSEIKKTNYKFRKINKPTDVLSFHLKLNEQKKQNYLGDIMISLETAKRQAKQKGIKLEKELKTLLIHGYLHLIGYDHKLEKEAKIMFSLQNNLLKEI